MSQIVERVSKIVLVLIPAAWFAPIVFWFLRIAVYGSVVFNIFFITSLNMTDMTLGATSHRSSTHGAKPSPGEKNKKKRGGSLPEKCL